MLTGLLVFVALAAIVVAAAVVVWTTALKDTELPGWVTAVIGSDDEDPATRIPTVSSESGEDQATRFPQEVRMIDINPSPRIVTLNGEGQSQQLSVQGFYSDGTTGELAKISDAEFSYTSSDPSVAEVSADGLITSLKAGGADITVTYGGFDAEVPVLVWGEIRQIPPIDPERVLEIDDDGTAIVLNRVMVELEPGYGPADAEDLAAYAGGRIIFEYETFPGYIVEIPAATEGELQAVLSAFDADNRVTTAYPDMLSSAAQGLGIESSDNIITDNAYIITEMNVAWPLLNQVPNLNPVIVFVIDTEYLHGGIPLKATSWRGTARSVIYNEFGDTDVFGSPSDFKDGQIVTWESNNGRIHVGDIVEGASNLQHGTAVVSILAAANNIPANPLGFSGVISSVNHLQYDIVFYAAGENSNLKVEGVITALSQINALEHIYPYRDQVAVVNLSLSVNCKKTWWFDCFDDTDPVSKGFGGNLFRLIQEMKETTFVVSAGNIGEKDIYKNNDVSAKKAIPALFSKYLDNVITVGGTTFDGTSSAYGTSSVWSLYSNYGGGVTVAAPYKVHAVNADPTGKHCYEDRVYDGYSGCNGTSFSAPLVSGTVALIKALNPQLSPSQIRDLLVSQGNRSESACIKGPYPTPTPSTTPRPGALPVPTVTPVPTPVPCSNPNDQLPILDAGAVINHLLMSVRNDIRPKAEPSLEVSGQEMIFNLPVTNNSDYGWKLIIDALALGPSGEFLVASPTWEGLEEPPVNGTKFVVPGHSTINLIMKFKEVKPHQVGIWNVQVNMFWEGEPTNSIWSRVWPIEIVPDDFSSVRPPPTQTTAAPVPTRAPTPRPTVMLTPTPGAGNACVVAPLREDWDPAYRYRTINLFSFEKPAHSHLMLKYGVGNPGASRDLFYLDVNVISHLGTFTSYNNLPMAELNINSGEAFTFIEYVVPDGGGDQHASELQQRKAWEKFDDSCPIHVDIAVYADPDKKKLLDNLLTKIDFKVENDARLVVEEDPEGAANAEVAEDLFSIFKCVQQIPDEVRSDIVTTLVVVGLFERASDANDVFTNYYSFVEAVKPLVREDPSLLPLVRELISPYCSGN